MITFYTNISKLYPNALEITGCSPNVSHLVIPSFIEGHPVYSIAKTAFRNRQDICSLIIEDGIQIIDVEAFEDCHHLISLQLPESIRSISTQAFQRCSALKELQCPPHLTKIENGAFTDCISLENVSLNDQLDHLGDFAFSGCERLTDLSYTIPPTYIGKKCFENTPLLQKDNHGFVTVREKMLIHYQGSASQVILPDRIQVIAHGAFQNNFSLKQLICNEHLRSIGPCAFQKCSSLRYVHKCDNVTCIYEYAFENCSQLNILPAAKKLNRLGAYCFAGCKELKQLILYPELTVIETGTFKDCSNIEHIYFSPHLRHISNHAFEGCLNIRRIDLPEGLMTLGSFAFSGCRNLTEVSLPHALHTIGEQSFYHCSKLHSFIAFNWNYPMGFLGQNVCTSLIFRENQMDIVLFFSDDLDRFLAGGRARLALSLYQAPEQISFSEYDMCFSYLKYTDDKILFVLNRLRYPTELSAENRSVFYAFLKEHIVEAVCFCARRNDTESVEYLCEDDLFSEETLEKAICMVNDLQHLPILSILMDRKKAPACADAFDSLFSL